jgi:hypothetical protein
MLEASRVMSPRHQQTLAAYCDSLADMIEADRELKANGATEDEWRPYAERTRQVFRYLAEHQDPAALADYEKRVEAEFARSIRQNNL